jgi:hypothetical protein
MTLKIRRTGASDYGQFTKVLVAGSPGAGKTLLSSTWPNAFYASAEGGLMSIADRGIPYTDVRTISDLLMIKTVLDNKREVVEETLGFPVDTVVVDTIDEVQRILVRERLEEIGKDTLAFQDWNFIAEQMAAIVRGFRNLPMHVIFTCHLKEVTDNDTGRTSYKPQIQGSYGDQISANVDLALLLKTTTKTEMIDNKAEKVTRRVLQTVPDLAHEWIKDRSGKLPAEIEIDFETDFQRINEYIFGGPKLKDNKVQEIVVELPELKPIKSAAEAAVRPVRRPRVAASSTPAPATPRLVREPVVPSESVVEPPVVEEPKVLEAQAEQPVITPVEEDKSVDGILVKNPDKFMPDKGLKLKPLDHGTDIYCQSCGNEIETIQRSELSMVRFRAFLCGTCYEEKKR